MTGQIDGEGIQSIRNIKFNVELCSRGYERSVLARYIALQYIRSPRSREEIDQALSASIKHIMRKDMSSPDKIKISKQDALSIKPKNKQEAEFQEKMKTMSENEIKQRVYECLHSDGWEMFLSNVGHSKGILKIDERAKSIFELRWTFLFAPKGTTFITSDSPCFSISFNNLGAGLLSSNGITIFPLKPNFCVIIDPRCKDKKECFLKIDKKRVREINVAILKNSYTVVVAKDKKHIEKLVKNYNYKNHDKTREVKSKKIGNYFVTMFN